MKVKHKNFATLLIVTGLLLISAATLIITLNMYEATQTGKMSANIASELDRTIVKQENTGLQTAATDSKMPVQTVEDNNYIGKLSIPSLKLELPVLSSWSYSKLRIAPCCYTGSAYSPGFSIAAHNYRGHFGRLNKLEIGDTVRFTDVGGNVYEYSVKDVSEIVPTNVEKVATQDFDLTLFTCTKSGKSRVVVHCERNKEQNFSENQP